MCIVYQEKSNKTNFKQRESYSKKAIKNFVNQKGILNMTVFVPWSGGKDSSYVAHQLKFKYGANRLLVTFSPFNTQ